MPPSPRQPRSPVKRSRAKRSTGKRAEAKASPGRRAASQRGSTAQGDGSSPSTSRLLNLGERSSAWLAAVGITDEASLRALGPVEAYRRVKVAFPRQVSWLMLYALHGALARTHWNTFPPEVKAQMRAEVERVMAAPSRPR